jgi:predicted MFS family arabinose efflux permease
VRSCPHGHDGLGPWGYAVYTFIAPLLTGAIGFKGAGIGYVLFLWGAAAFVGLFLGGMAMTSSAAAA